ncbi:MAG: 4Fe-4S binding protein [Deltaproteobacteria bacterium]|nr:4Fe-4S binding protein [Deltaproteobacteria bacterium]MBT4265708.1 4Fe-4S binding protein [Deltaproteobacteria bacterium]MBT4641798.1 4Fe-4S binding protein [Deltaproteobacteria bacterium]MBT6503470.1 4Fe-4S binding protein [Deltaproteobacteria bacterium]MBT6612537.1 4Fe-4S binding protein [Deltaproteobacteria bacterium]
MSKDDYRKVQRQLDQYCIGFPATESGVEIDIIKELFNEKEAGLFSKMEGELETPESVSQRIGQPVEEVAKELEAMAVKGLLFRVREAGAVKYSAIPFIHGLLEFQISWMPKKLVHLTGNYIKEILHENLASTLAMRVLPVNESIEVKNQVASYDDVYEILKKEELIAVADCACRVQKKVFDRACDSPMEVCMMVGPMAEYYLENKMGRQITLEEAMRITRESNEAGLVTQTQSVTRPFMICNCCKCCCGFLGAQRRTPFPGKLVISNHMAVIKADQCSGCEICPEYCQTEAITMNAEGIAEINYDRCIGCGLCISSCPDDALSLIAKPDKVHNAPMKTLHEQLASEAEKRLNTKLEKNQVVDFGFN